MWIAALVSAGWANRHDLARWTKFAKRAAAERHTRPMSDLLTEAKVRMAVTTDPLLRRDKALQDLNVNDGVVTLLTATPGWPDPRDQIWRIKRVKGITDVRSELTSTGV